MSKLNTNGIFDVTFASKENCLEKQMFLCPFLLSQRLPLLKNKASSNILNIRQRFLVL
jgi:hypothetical protein